MNMGQRIKARRKELGMNADKLAELLGKNRSTIFRYEKGEIENLPLDALEPLAAALKTTPAYSRGWDEKQKNNDVIAHVIVKLRADEEFLSVVDSISKLDSEKLNVIKSMVSALLK